MDNKLMEMEMAMQNTARRCHSIHESQHRHQRAAQMIIPPEPASPYKYLFSLLQHISVTTKAKWHTVQFQKMIYNSQL
jgi:hypothetical protein